METARSGRRCNGDPPSPPAGPGSGGGPARKGRAAPLRILPALLLSSAFAVVPTGCATADSRYRVLSFFFDGVPDPAEALEAEKADPARGLAGPGPAAAAVRPGSIHRPYAERLCQRCHGNPASGGEFGGGFGASLRGAWGRCLGCHDGSPSDPRGPSVLGSGPWLHAPAAAGECGICHEAHESPYRRLLRAADVAEICLSCHGDPVSCPQDRNGPDVDCARCHDPHGAADAGRRFLRERSGERR